jgi:hypothetical protein
MVNFIPSMSLIHSYSGNAKFIFTGRTGVRLGGSEYA